MLHVDTRNRKAFELLNAAVAKIGDYQRTLNNDLLDGAYMDLHQSIQADPQYLKPAKYMGIVYELKGETKEAIAQFQRTLENAPEEYKNDLRYNLGVANYHLYVESHIENAITLFQDIIASAGEDELAVKLLANANLAQCYAMMVLHSMKRKGSGDAELYFNRVGQLCDSTLEELRKERKSLNQEAFDQTSWILHNARGVSLMFVSDGMPYDSTDTAVSAAQLDRLQQAKVQYGQALEFSPRNWALWCNIGSIDMRMGYWYKVRGQQAEAEKLFAHALEALDRVVKDIRRNYDFALYEMGRIYRLNQDFDKAISYFERAIIAGKDNANISESTIVREIKAAASGNDLFPLPY